ncbi:competence protein ComK [Bacillus weihaiensis]|uniref:competence protein ComK n=1 Tax=Bacillus weihaiensis TaxID=1547283 RepID=UPI0023526DFF|nr:competence protein ComK [Bacillus weihaiensis]
MKKVYSITVCTGGIITDSTMGIFPHYTNTGHVHCQMLDKYGEKLVEKDPRFVLNTSCIYYGSDFNGRLESARHILIGKKNLPIMVSLSLGICMIPLSSPMKNDTPWISLRYIEDIQPNGAGSIITFQNDVKVEVNITKNVVEDRRNKASRLFSTYYYRKMMGRGDIDSGFGVAEKPGIYY